jgi:hypothetical protein
MTNSDFINEIRSKFRKPNSTQLKVFNLLSDQKWHCRNCEGKNVASNQYAGGGGIQGLERGTKSRPGLLIESKDQLCKICNQITRWDRWTGEIKTSNAAAAIPKGLIKKILEFYKYIDVIEQRERPEHELVIDHRFPMERWEAAEETLNYQMTDAEIKVKFQLLKKDAAGNHNLLKSRSCERCIKLGKRGTPFGIRFWYQGDENWSSPHTKGSQAEEGCVGCGWYDFDTWRTALNEKIKTMTDDYSPQPYEPNC